MCSQLIYDAVKFSIQCFRYIFAYSYIYIMHIHEKALEIVCGKITLRKSITFSFLFHSHALRLSSYVVCFPFSSALSKLFSLSLCICSGNEERKHTIWVVGSYWVVVKKERERRYCG